MAMDIRDVDHETVLALMYTESEMERQYGRLMDERRAWLRSGDEVNAAWCDALMVEAARDAADKKRALLLAAGYPEDFQPRYTDVRP